jgi:hypothetical protein
MSEDLAISNIVSDIESDIVNIATRKWLLALQ